MNALRPLMIAGYASLFHEADLIGDVVRPGAFERAVGVRGPPGVAMLLGHRRGAIAGRWTEISEDARGLKVRGVIDPAWPAGRAALKAFRYGGLSGLSIGFFARGSEAAMPDRRTLTDIDLREISLVAAPLAPGARFRAVNRPTRSSAQG